MLQIQVRKLEDEIKQKRFDSEQHKLIINLIFTSNWLNGISQKQFKPFGITPQQYNVLRILKGQFPNPASVGMVQERMLDKSSNITRLVDKLLEKEFVSRCENPSNRRMQELRITDKGLGFLTAVSAQQKNFLELTSHISDEEATRVNEILDKLRN